jgi:argininosuccinate synthase
MIESAWQPSFKVPVGEKVGTFSGGLDTSAALHWMRVPERRDPYAYTANLGQPDERTTTRSRKALAYGAEQARLIDCRAQLVAEGISALQCGAFHISTAAFPTSTRHRIGRAHRDDARPGHEGDEVNIWGDGSTFKGNDIERLSIPAGQPWLRIYSPGWTRRSSTSSAAARKCPDYKRVGLAYKMSVEKVLTDSNPRRDTRSQRPGEHLNSGIRIVEPIMGVASWRGETPVKPGRSDHHIRGRQPCCVERTSVLRFGRADARGQRHRRTAWSRHERSDREPDHRGQEPRHLRGAGMRSSSSDTSGS